MSNSTPSLHLNHQVPAIDGLSRIADAGYPLSTIITKTSQAGVDSAAASHGDVLPFTALGRECASRGHVVVLDVNPAFRGCANDASISFEPISTVNAYNTFFIETTDNVPTTCLSEGKERAGGCPAYYRAMKADILPGKTITINNSLLFAARLLHETDGIPNATAHLAPFVFQSNFGGAFKMPSSCSNASKLK